MKTTRRVPPILVALLAAALAGATPAGAAAAGVVTFSDATKAAGITFTHANGAFGKKYMPETMGSGACAIDVENDGDQDLLFVSSTAWPGRKGPVRTSLALYRNAGKGRFAEATAEARLGRTFYGMGCAVGNFDDDGFADLYVTALGPNLLFRNNGDGTFADVTAKAGVAGDGWSTSAAWLDYDRDGDLDLFVGHYVQWSEAKDIWCTLDGKNKSYCTPEPYDGTSNRLYRNNGDGTFTDVTDPAGVGNPNGKTLGVAVYPDAEGWPNIVVANDTQPNFLYVNKRNGTFADEAVEAGIAFDENGKARGAMGLDLADFQRTGKLGLAIGNFSHELISFYVQEREGFFFDVSGQSKVGPAGLTLVKFGLFFFDYNLDGLDDLFIVNGHVEDEIEKIQPEVTHAQRSLLFLNTGGGAFREVGLDSGQAIARKIVGRGAAYLDADGDGDLDIAVSTNNGPAHLLRNDGGSRNHRIRLTLLRGDRSGDGIGARVTLKTASGQQVKWVKSGSSYLSQSELPLTFGLGGEAREATAEILWPDGTREVVKGLKTDHAYTIRERRGILASAALGR